MSSPASCSGLTLGSTESAEMQVCFCVQKASKQGACTTYSPDLFQQYSAVLEDNILLITMPKLPSCSVTADFQCINGHYQKVWLDPLCKYSASIHKLLLATALPDQRNNFVQCLLASLVVLTLLVYYWILFYFSATQSLSQYARYSLQYSGNKISHSDGGE